MSRSQKLCLVVFAVVVGVVITVRLSLSLLITPSFVEQLLQDNLNCDVAIEAVAVKVLQREIALKGLSLTSRNPADDTTAVEAGSIALGVKLLPLFSRRLETTRFVIEEPMIQARFQKDGDFSLAELFRVPSGERGQEVSRSSTSSHQKVLPAERNRWLAKLSEARLENGSVEFTFEKENLTLTIDALAISVRDLRFDPEELTTLNEVNLELAGNAVLRDREQRLLVKMDLSGTAGGKLFEEQTGEFKPDLLARLQLAPDSHLDPRVKIVRRAWAFTEKANQIGIRVGDLPARIDFGGDRLIKVHYLEGTATLREPLSLQAGIWELGLATDSWIETFSGNHEIGIEFLAGGQAGRLASEWSQKLPQEVRKVATTRFLTDSRVLWRVNSSGELSDPEFDFLSQIPEASDFFDDLEESLEEEAERLREKAKGFLNDLLDF